MSDGIKLSVVLLNTPPNFRSLEKLIAFRGVLDEEQVIAYMDATMDGI